MPRSTPEKTAKNKEKLLIALEKTLGVITMACKETGISRQSYHKWYNEDEEFRRRVDEIEDIQTDFVENQLFKKIKEGSERSILFYMKYKGKKRGYNDSIDITTGGKPFEPIQINYIKPNENN
jgi:hypothetical protein